MRGYVESSVRMIRPYETFAAFVSHHAGGAGLAENR